MCTCRIYGSVGAWLKKNMGTGVQAQKPEAHLADFVPASCSLAGQTLMWGARESLALKTTASWLSHSGYFQFQ